MKTLMVKQLKRRQRFFIDLITAVFVGLAAPPEEFRLEYGRYLWEQI